MPERFKNDAAEEEYISKFRRLIEYLDKLREKDESQTPLDIKFVCNADIKTDIESGRMDSTPGIARNSMQRFYIQLRKGKRDTMEWMEVAVDSTFNTAWSYRIMFNWLVASSGKVDTQVQLLQRRCTQYGLNLVPIPQITVSRSPYLYPFKAPTILTVRSKEKAALLDAALADIDFLHDGVFYTDTKAILECIEKGYQFSFGQRWGVPATGRQFVHRSGTLFVRILTDKKGLALLVVVGNYRYMQTSNKDDETLKRACQKAFRELTDRIESLEPKAEIASHEDKPSPDRTLVLH
jgi:hypothetical protein